MPVEDRATVFQADADRGRQQHRRGQRKQDGGGHDVDGSLRRMVPGRRPVRLDVEHRQTGHRSGANPAAEHSGQPGPELDVQPAGQAGPYRGGALGRGHRAADEDHAFGTDLVGELRKVGQRRPVRNVLPGCRLGLLAHDASDSVTELRLVGEHLPHGRGVLVGTYEHYGLQEVPVRPLVLQPPPIAPAQHDHQCGGAYRSLCGGCGGYGRDRAGEPAGSRQHAPAYGRCHDYPGGLAGELRAHPGPVQAGPLNHRERRNGSR